MLERFIKIYTKIIGIGINNDLTIVNKEQIRLINISSIVIAIQSLPLCLIFLYLQFEIAAIYSLFSGFLFLTPLLLNYLGHNAFSKGIFITILNLLIFKITLLFGTHHFLEMAFLLPISLSFFLYREKGKIFHIISVFLLVLVLLNNYVYQLNLLGTYLKVDLPHFFVAYIIFLVLGLLWLFFILFINSINRFENQIDRLISKTNKQYQSISDINQELNEHKINLEALVVSRSQEMLNTKELLKSIINSSPDLIFYKDNNSQYLGCNRAYAQFMGIDPNDIVGKSDYDYYSKERADLFVKGDREIIDYQKNVFFEEWISNVKGEKVFLDTIKTPIINDKGKAIGVIGVSRDLTLIKQYQTALEENEEKYKTIYSTSLDGILTIKPDGEIISANPSAIAMFHIGEEVDLLNASLFGFFSNTDQQSQFTINKVKSFLSNAMEQKSTNVFCSFVRKDDTSFEAKLLFVLMRIGNETLIQVNIRDVSEEIASKNKIQKNLKYQELVNCISIQLSGQELIDGNINGLLELTATTMKLLSVFMFYKNGKEHYFQWDKQQDGTTDYMSFLASHFNDIEIFTANKKVLEININEFKKHEQSHSSQLLEEDIIYIIPIKQKQQLVGCLGFKKNKEVANWNDEESTLSVIVNIIGNAIDREHNRAELVLAKQKAEESDKLKSEFLANISHETRTPLNLIIGYSEILEASLHHAKVEGGYIHKIKKAGNNLLTILENILDLSKIEAGLIKIQKENINPYILIKEIELAFSAKIAQKQLSFKIDVDSNLPKYIILDKVRTRQVIFNIVGNAVKFTEKGEINVTVRSLPVLNIDQNSNSIDLEIEVKDTGIGISERDLEYIFDPFRQVDGGNTRKYEGTGMGLTIAKKLTQILGGEITVESLPNTGTIFKLVFYGVEVPEEFNKKGHSKDKKNSNVKKIKFNELSDYLINVEEIPENLAEIINNELRTKAKSLRECLELDEALLFSERLIEIGNEYNNVGFTSFGEELKILIDKVAVSEIEYCLSIFDKKI